MFFALYLNGSAMSGDDLFALVQTNAQTLFFCGLKWLKQTVLDKFIGHPNTGISNFNFSKFSFVIAAAIFRTSVKIDLNQSC